MIESKYKFSKETKIAACKKYHTGVGSLRSIAEEVGCGKSTLHQWYNHYQNHGEDAFNILPYIKSYDQDFMIFVVEQYLSGAHSMNDLAAKHNISHSMVKRWVDKYNNGIELKSNVSKGDIYTMKSRKTTYEERLKIVNWILSNDLNYSEAAKRYNLNYALVYKWTRAYLDNGEEALQYKKRGPKKQSANKSDLSEVEQLKQSLEKEIALRKRRELELEILKKKEEIEKKLRYQK